jgi:hypothetical protein
MKTFYAFRLFITCFITLLFSAAPFAQTIQLNGVPTTCTSVITVPIASGLNIITNPAGCLPTVPVTTDPTILSLSPTCANPGATVSINGLNLGGTFTVFVGGQNVAPSSVSATRVQFVIPANATLGAATMQIGAAPTNPTYPFQVGNCGGLAAFTVALSTAPGVAVTSASAGAKLILAGTGLGGATVTVIGVPATVSAGATATQLEITIPQVSGAGTIAVTNTAGTATTPFTVALSLIPVLPVNRLGL